MTSNVMVVMPTYNEAENLPIISAELLSLKEVPNLRLLVVDDNSPDGTGKIADDLALQYPNRVFVLHRTEKNGLGPAYVAGFKRALELNADLIVQMDADGSHQPKYIADLLARLEKGADVVIGSRFVRGGGVDKDWSPYRKLLSWFANRVYVRTLLGINVADATGGFRLWKSAVLIGLDLDRIRSNGYVFQVELAYVTARLGYKLAEVPIYFPDRRLGDSKMDARIQIEAAMRVFQVMARHRGLRPSMRRTTSYNVE